MLRHRAEQAAAAAAAAKRDALAVAAQRDELQRVRLAGIWEQFKQTQRCSSLSCSSKSCAAAAAKWEALAVSAHCDALQRVRLASMSSTAETSFPTQYTSKLPRISLLTGQPSCSSTVGVALSASAAM